jgi:hypothetical protein
MFDDPTDEWHEWYRLTPLARWAETEKLWAQLNRALEIGF